MFPQRRYTEDRHSIIYLYFRVIYFNPLYKGLKEAFYSVMKDFTINFLRSLA